jgi:hypothetical protein
MMTRETPLYSRGVSTVGMTTALLSRAIVAVDQKRGARANDRRHCSEFPWWLWHNPGSATCDGKHPVKILPLAEAANACFHLDHRTDSTPGRDWRANESLWFVTAKPQGLLSHGDLSTAKGPVLWRPRPTAETPTTSRIRVTSYCLA